MKLVRFRTEGQGPRLGAVVTRGDTVGIIDLSAIDPDLPTSLRHLLLEGPAGLERVGRLIESHAAAGLLGDAQLLAPMAHPHKLLAAAANYQEHIREGGGQPVDKTRIVPKLFMKPSSSIIAPGAPLVLPAVSDTVDWELELAVVIGRDCKDVPLDRALDVVGGYSVINDVSARSMSWGLADREPGDWNGFFDWLNGKWLDGFAPLGPWFVTADEVPDPQALDMELRVNGQVRQKASTADMIFGVAELVSFASRFMTLEVGDIIATGTPSGVGDASGTYLRPGDVMEGTITGLGTLTTPVVAG